MKEIQICATVEYPRFYSKAILTFLSSYFQSSSPTPIDTRAKKPPTASPIYTRAYQMVDQIQQPKPQYPLYPTHCTSHLDCVHLPACCSQTLTLTSM